MSSSESTTTGVAGLKKALGKLESYATLVGILVGSGIFVVVGQAGALTGPSVPLAYLALLPIVLATALGYIVYMSTPLGNCPGGAYTHISRTFGAIFPAFMAVWLQGVAYMGALGLLATAMGEYVKFIFPEIDPLVAGSAALVFFAAIQFFGINIYGRIQVGMFVLLLLAIVLLVGPGLFAIKLENFSPLFPYGLKGFMAAIPPLFISYAAFESLAQSAGETKEAQKNLPMIFVRGLIATVIIYFFMALVAFGVLPYQAAAASNTVMADAAAQYLPGIGSLIVALGAIMACTTSINATMMVPPRLLLVLSDDHLTPKAFSKLHPVYKTPYIGQIITLVMALALMWTRTLDAILAVTLQAIFLLYIIHGVALICLPFVNRKLYDQAMVRPPVWFTVLGGCVSVVALIYCSYSMLLNSWKVILAWSLAGTIIYIVAVMQARMRKIDLKQMLMDQ